MTVYDVENIARIFAYIMSSLAQVSPRISVKVDVTTSAVVFDVHMDRFDDMKLATQRALGAGIWADVSISSKTCDTNEWRIERYRIASVSITGTPEVMIANAATLTKLSLAMIEVRSLLEELIRMIREDADVIPEVLRQARAYVVTPKA